MKRGARASLDDIIEGITVAESYVAGLTQDEFLRDHKTQDAVIRRLEIIGEAVKQLPMEIRERYPAIPWRSMAGLRDVMIHEYANIILGRVWRAVREELPGYKSAISEIRNGLPPEP